ncbi:MAG: right-handed parallel beta-helix repeat-containing protein [Dysgonamonadaceae bacterium]|jgi:hypothetical protein|nr:right-handed parallel beta-helix repeat-containing protein [Dysgonamonadaceae bacterium]
MKQVYLFLSACMLAGMVHATVYYVSPEGDNSDGKTWATAFQSPAKALSTVTSGSHEVWVKQGTYISATTLKWIPGANFYGGFTGTEISRDERNTDPSLTILEGTRTSGVLTTPQSAYSTLWNGFTIQKGKATGGGGGIFLQRNTTLENCIVQDNEATNYGGGGIYIQDANNGRIQILNCIVRNNKLTPTAADRDGGGITVRATKSSDVLIGNCIIEGNIVDAGAQSRAFGGGISLLSGATVANCIIRNNQVTKPSGSNCNGGGMYISLDDAGVSANISNCIIANNFCDAGNGGGVFVTEKAGNVSFGNCHIVNNQITYASYGGGGIFTKNPATVVNCVFWGNDAPGSTPKHFRTDGGGSVSYCAFDAQANGTAFGTATVADNITVETENLGNLANAHYAAFVRPTAFAGKASNDIELAELQQADWSPLATSALINAGTTVAVITDDMAGIARPQGTAYDIGAYEFEEKTTPGTGIDPAQVKTAFDAPVYTTSGNIVLKNAEDNASAIIYDITGRTVKNVHLAVGENTISVPSRGLYYVKTGQSLLKVMVR